MLTARITEQFSRQEENNIAYPISKFSFAIKKDVNAYSRLSLNKQKILLQGVGKMIIGFH